MLVELAIQSALSATLFAPGTLEKPASRPACRLADSMKAYEAGPGITLDRIMEQTDGGPSTRRQLERALRSQYKMDYLWPGARIDLAFTPTGEIAWLRYRPSLTGGACVARAGRGWAVTPFEVPIDRDVERVVLEPSASLAKAIEDAGEDASLEGHIRELFPSMEIETAKILVDRHSVEGEFLTYARIQAAEVVAGGTTFFAFYYEDPSGYGGYYTERGVALQPLHLHDPVPHAITASDYGVRRHPIRRVRRLHKGIDFAAPRNTTVHAAANGVVLEARYAGPLGRMVVLDHGNGLTTRYAHLDGFAPGVTTGVLVHRGDPIGRIGTSGLTTGAHLHFETLLEEEHVNPKKVTTPFPPGITYEMLPQFEEHVATMLDRLGSTIAVAGSS
jgi:murein DD-endopeptidase MepM/ murein hydrolase activator NlpD